MLWLSKLIESSRLDESERSHATKKHVHPVPQEVQNNKPKHQQNRNHETQNEPQQPADNQEPKASSKKNGKQHANKTTPAKMKGQPQDKDRDTMEKRKEAHEEKTRKTKNRTTKNHKKKNRKEQPTKEDIINCTRTRQDNVQGKQQPVKQFMFLVESNEHIYLKFKQQSSTCRPGHFRAHPRLRCAQRREEFCPVHLSTWAHARFSGHSVQTRHFCLPRFGHHCVGERLGLS